MEDELVGDGGNQDSDGAGIRDQLYDLGVVHSVLPLRTETDKLGLNRDSSAEAEISVKRSFPE
jgi:hypothetical protein